VTINLPGWLVEVVNLLGFNWPAIDEDQLKEAAGHLRTYAANCEASHDTTHRIVTGDLQQVYAAQSYTALAELWGSQTQGHMKSLIEACRLLADGLDIAAEGVATMKGACIVQLGVAAGELLVDTGAAVFTFGLSEAAAAAEIELQNRLLDGIMQQFEQEVIGALVNQLIGPLKEQVDQAVQKLLFEEVTHLAVGGPTPGLKLDTGAMRGHGEAIMREAEGNLSGGREFGAKMSNLTFTTGG
jgi:hypothetical protein